MFPRALLWALNRSRLEGGRPGCVQFTHQTGDLNPRNRLVGSPIDLSFAVLPEDDISADGGAMDSCFEIGIQAIQVPHSRITPLSGK